MIQNYLLSIKRYTSRNKGFTFINVLGLATGIMACMLITQYVLHEFSYDNFHEKKENIYRVQLDRYDKGELSTRWASGAAGIGPDFKSNYPEVKNYVRMMRRSSVFRYQDVFFKEDHTCWASEDFFKIFSVKLIHGIDSLVLKEPFKVVISESFAKRYFGDENPIGKTLRHNGETDYEVTGVFADLPINTHMEFDALMSFESLKKLWNDDITSWNWDGFYTYLELADGTNPDVFESKLPALTQKINGEEMKRFNADMKFNLQPIADIHLDSNFIGEFKANGDRESTYFLSVVAVLILIIAWINYVNLSTAKSIERAREVGVRKVMGGFRWQLIQQFLFESLLLNVLAVLIAIVFVIILTPWFSELLGRKPDYLLFQQNMFWVWITLLILCGSLLAGLYPAFVLSSYKPVEVLKGRFKNSSKGVIFRKGMVVTQFIASITLIVGTFTVYQQIDFMQSRELGINIDQTLVLNSPNVVDSTYEQKFQVFKQRISQNAEVSAVTASTSVPGSQPGWNAGGIRRLSQGEDEAKQYRVIMMDHDFVETYKLAIVAGRDFSGEISGEEKNVMINESSVKQLGYSKPEDAVNDQIFFWGDTFRIVGVMKNYHQESLKKAHEPLIFRYNNAPGGFYSIKFNTSHVKESIAKFEEEWAVIFPGNPFIHFFLDDHYNEQYQADQRFGKVFGIFSALAIIIACLGLFGLSSLTAIQRTKEIGVRKVLGASVSGILGLVGKDYIILMVIAIALSIPLAAWAMNGWLQNFENRIALSWYIFALPGLFVTVIALGTVSIHTLKAARLNPAKSLRYE